VTSVCTPSICTLGHFCADGLVRFDAARKRSRRSQQGFYSSARISFTNQCFRSAAKVRCNVALLESDDRLDAVEHPLGQKPFVPPRRRQSGMQGQRNRLPRFRSHVEKEYGVASLAPVLPGDLRKLRFATLIALVEPCQ